MKASNPLREATAAHLQQLRLLLIPQRAQAAGQVIQEYAHLQRGSGCDCGDWRASSCFNAPSVQQARTCTSSV